MQGQNELTRPLARTDNLIVRALPDETLVYDLDNNKAHCLNATAALVWQHCDGRTSVYDLAARLTSDAQPTQAHEQMVWLALKQLAKDRLLAAPITPPATMSGLNRRQMIRTLGLTAAIALPLVTTIIAPTPAQAANSCLPTGASCGNSIQCCNGICQGNGTCN